MALRACRKTPGLKVARRIWAVIQHTWQKKMDSVHSWLGYAHCTNAFLIHSEHDRGEKESNEAQRRRPLPLPASQRPTKLDDLRWLPNSSEVHHKLLRNQVEHDRPPGTRRRRQCTISLTLILDHAKAVFTVLKLGTHSPHLRSKSRSRNSAIGT